MCLPLVLIMALGAGPVAADYMEIAPVISFQGRILDAAGEPVAGPVDLGIALYQTDSDPLPRYRESHPATPLANGVYTILIGTGVEVEGLLNPDTFYGGSAMLEVSVNGEVLAPRQRFASTPYAFRAVTAAMASRAGDADSVGGRSAASLDQSAHVADLANPHQVTAAQAGAATPAEVGGAVVAHAGDASAHHAKTSSFPELSGQVADGQIPASIARDSELAWGRLSGIPGGFADGSDDGITAETDPQVGSMAVNSVPRWDGSALGQGSIFDVGNVGIGVAAPADKLEVAGNLRFSPGADRSISLPDGTKSLFIGGGSTPPWSLWLQSSSYLAIKTGGAERLRVNSEGLTFPDGSKQSTAYRGFPRPDYDSGWVTDADNGARVLTHNLGESVDDYVVDLTFRNSGGQHIKFHGAYWLNDGSGILEVRGLYWSALTTTTITVGGKDAGFPEGGGLVDEFRVRIWVHE